MPGSRPTRASAFVVQVTCLLALTSLLAGCVDEPAVPATGPLTVQEAVRLAGPELDRRAPAAHLLGFVGHEGPAPRYLDGLLGQYVANVDASFDAKRGDGRAHVWVLLYGTPEGDLLRILVRDSPRAVTADWAAAPSGLVEELWAMNLGGRLLVDSPEAARTMQEANPAIRQVVADGADVAYASTVAPVGGPGTEDLLHAYHFGHPERRAATYDHFGQVDHFEGRLVATGSASEAQAKQRAVLMDESFVVGPYPAEVGTTVQVPRRIEAANLTLDAAGTGSYEVALWYENQSRRFHVEDQVVESPNTHAADLGVLEPGAYTLQVAVVGRITFDLHVEGDIGL